MKLGTYPDDAVEFHKRVTTMNPEQRKGFYQEVIATARELDVGCSKPFYPTDLMHGFFRVVLSINLPSLFFFG
ncbi:hypothetical protein NHP190003_16050 (plasmid) [Helicobacter sp. NHP19-003]|uniref:Uncharacterized protein n=1 Tax=Helicobacter gastrocanis TaxID=2849641 RepID=A0ABN6I457_9HELI|nr:hypothetical protein [Helicobacter sp. NHP19-003]BCZ18323.1 hypothetical protein NHP190003_16050 [Helicobacter sp. NHP19-003]